MGARPLIQQYITAPIAFLSASVLAGVIVLSSPPKLRLVEVEPPVPMLRQLLADRPIEETERRFAIAPLVYINENNNRESYGLDLPEPSYEQCYIEQVSTAYPTGTKKMRVVKMVDRQCWGLLLTHPKWLKVSPTSSVPVLTSPGFVQTK